MSRLLTPLRVGETTFAHRAWVSPMCQYSCDPVAAPGVVQDWHLVHLGSFALGGAALVMTESAAVVPEGRIAPQDAGLWNDTQGAAWARIVSFLHQQGAAAGVQLNHAGRKGSSYRPWSPVGGSVPAAEGGWPTLGPSPVAFGDYAAPAELDQAGIDRIVEAFAAAASRADRAGFDVVEIHAAHGYLFHQFLSPLSNHRTDGYGGDLAGRSRLLIEVVDAIRTVWAPGRPLFVRISTTDWVDGGWSVEDSVALSTQLAAHGVDLIDASSGGNVPDATIPVGPGYQVPAAGRIKRETGVLVAAVGMVLDPTQAEQVLVAGDADAVFLARALLADPRWPQRAAAALHEVDAVAWPPQYVRATRAPVPHVVPR